MAGITSSILFMSDILVSLMPIYLGLIPDAGLLHRNQMIGLP
jgi:hypothetical protein